MTAKIKRHFLIPERGVEVIDMIDEHKREFQLQVPILKDGKRRPEEEIDQEIAAAFEEFKSQAEAISAHKAVRFDEITLERKK